MYAQRACSISVSAHVSGAAVHIGRRIGFTEGDIERIITRGREKLPGGMGGRHD